MATFPVPDEVILGLVLLPGYVIVRVGLYFARYTGPVDWAEYEKIALSLVGSVTIIAGVSIALPSFVDIGTDDGEVFVITDVTPEGYVATLIGAIVVGAILGTVVYETFGELNIRSDPKKLLLKRLERPVPVRVVTDEREIVGGVYADKGGDPTVLSRPRLVTSRNGKEWREPMGRYVYVDPRTIQSIHYGSTLSPAPVRGGFVRRVLGRIFFPPEADVGLEGSVGGRTGPAVSVSKNPLLREGDLVRARGTLRNELSREIRFVQIKVEFEDADGSILGMGVDSFERLGEGDAWRFDVTHEADDPNAIESFSVKWYASPHI